MSQRYITEGDKTGQKRRMEAYRKRLEEQGIKPRQLLLTDQENIQVRKIVALWRDEDCDLEESQKTAATVLKP